MDAADAAHAGIVPPVYKHWSNDWSHSPVTGPPLDTSARLHDSIPRGGAGPLSGRNSFRDNFMPEGARLSRSLAIPLSPSLSMPISLSLARSLSLSLSLAPSRALSDHHPDHGQRARPATCFINNDEGQVDGFVRKLIAKRHLNTFCEIRILFRNLKPERRNPEHERRKRDTTRKTDPETRKTKDQRRTPQPKS